MNRTNEARTTFSLFDKKINPELYGLSNLALAEMEASQGNKEEAIISYKALLETLDKKHKLRARAWQGVGNNLLELNRYDEALEAYENVLKSKPDTRTNFETRVKIGETLERQQKYDGALDAYQKILKIKRLRIYEAEIRLKQAHIYQLKDQTETAEEIYSDIGKKYPRSEYSAAAFYRLGLIEQKSRKNLEKSKELFEKAVREDRSSDEGKLALQRQKDLVALERYQTQIEKVEDPQKALGPLFDLAELYLFNLGEPDSALSIYQRVLTLTDTTDLSPRVRYAIGLIYADSLKNETAAREHFQLLLDQHPNTPYAVEARTRLNQKHADDALAESRFLQAENLIAEGTPTRDILPIYQQIADEYPNSLFAPKALFALAWTYENNLDQREQAKTVYEQVQERYPLTQYGKIATDKLKGKFLDPPPEPADTTQTQPSDTQPDTTRTDPADAPPDTTATPPDISKLRTQKTPPPKPAFKPNVIIGGGIMEAVDADEEPQVIEEIEPEYPEEARAEGKPAMVFLRLLILKNGSVGEVHVISGPELFHSAAVEAAKQYTFEPGIHEDAPRDMWTDIAIHFEPPE
ncbi:MAG: TonB family protein [Gemmatimonadetes bacterium]|nr:TonB family protein [Gemmatimonadota bacterium]